MRPDLKPEIMTKTTVGANWKPYRTAIEKKFKIIPRFERMLLESEENLRLEFKHMSGVEKVYLNKSRKLNPTYLVLLRNLKSDSSVKINICNTIMYDFVEKEKDQAGEGLSQGIIEIISDWSDEEFE
jgi:peroxiredoxin family protein